MNDIQALETSIGTTLPAALKAILTNLPAIIPGKDRFMRKVDDGFDQELSIHRFMSLAEMQGAWNNLKGDTLFSEEKLLPFAETLGSPMICIGFGNENYGQVYVFDY